MNNIPTALENKQNGTETAPFGISQDVLGEFLARIAGKPNCNKAGCFGRGWVAVVLAPDGTARIQICGCGRVGESEYAMIAARWNTLQGELGAIREIQTATHTHITRKRWWQKKVKQ